MSEVFELNPAVTKHKKRVAAKSFQVTTKNVASLPNFNLIYKKLLQREKTTIISFSSG